MSVTLEERVAALERQVADLVALIEKALPARPPTLQEQSEAFARLRRGEG